MDESRARRLKRGLAWGVPIALFVGVMGLWPLPYYIYGPWSADDLDKVVHVQGHTPPPGVLYDTSILVLPGRPSSYIIGTLLPGFSIVPRSDLASPSMNDIEVLEYMYESREASKHSAEVVAARAAGLHLDVERSIFIARLSPQRPTGQCFRAGDRLLRVDGVPIDTTKTLVSAAEAHPAGHRFAVAVERRGRAVALYCTTVSIRGAKRFGVNLQEVDRPGPLPFAVTYDLPFYQSGGSTGLMFALQIYRSLTGADLTHGGAVAGTGVIDQNGVVLPIVGARQKVIAARKAGAAVFLVPRQNYAEIAGSPGIRVIPIGSFDEAVNWLSWRLRGCPRAADDVTSLTGIAFADLPIGDVEQVGMRLPPGVLRLDYGHAACNLVRFWYFWNDRSRPLHVHFSGPVRDVTLRFAHGATQLEIVDTGKTYRETLARPPDGLVGYFISGRPGFALWTSPRTFEHIGFDDSGIVLWHAQPPEATPPR